MKINRSGTLASCREKTEGDYSLGSMASTLRDLIVALGYKRATVVGQSYGGGIAMQFAYQYPERCERLVLVDAGGLGSEVNPLLRMLTLPGSEAVLLVACAPRVAPSCARCAPLLTRVGNR
jgi:pimeloyl-ACP methyl ester carboxylesterase